jgi:hypothetical protein
MAYPYYPNFNNPYQQGFYQPMFQQTQQQPVMPQQQTPAPAQSYAPQQTTSGIIWISGPQEAQMFPIAPNNAVALWEKSGKTIYLKSADATGKPNMIVYDLVERTQAASDSASESDGKTPSYATKDELSAVVGVVKGFDEVLGTLKSDIDTLKGDMYGLSGRKKTAPKKTAEVQDDD